MKPARMIIMQTAKTVDKRYRLYREHKYVTIMMNDFEKSVQLADFSNTDQVNGIKEKLNSLKSLMEGHAAHEESAIHKLLKDKACTLHEPIELDHKDHKDRFQELDKILDDIISAPDGRERNAIGYAFYILFRDFQKENLRHINEEEMTIMPALQQFYTDDQIRNSVDFKTYALMSSEDMVHMTDALFQVMNLDDKEFFIRDLKDSQPEKFYEAWKVIGPKLDVKEREILEKKLDINYLILDKLYKPIVNLQKTVGHQANASATSLDLDTQADEDVNNVSAHKSPSPNL